MATATENRKRKRRTFTMDDDTYDYLAGVAATVVVSPCVMSWTGCVFLYGEPHERFTTMAQQARAN